MSGNIVNKVAYLRTTWDFPQEAEELTEELTRSYLEVANAVNVRTIGIYPVNRPAQTGNSWYFKENQKQQTLRQIYQMVIIGGVVQPIPHKITIARVAAFAQIYGTFLDNMGIWYPLPFVSETLATNQVSVIVNQTDIVVTRGATAPAITKGFVVLEWVSQP